MKQSLVTKKNRKLRRLRELYPEVSIKLLYRRDYRSLMMKYGLDPGSTPAESTESVHEEVWLPPETTVSEPQATEEELSPE